MNTRKIIASIVLVDFAALNGYALYTQGLSGFVDLVMNASPWVMVLLADIIIALGLVLVWLWRDAKSNGRNPVGYTLLTFCTGSLGPLLYIVSGDRAEHPEEVVAPETRIA